MLTTPEVMTAAGTQHTVPLLPSIRIADSPTLNDR